MYGRFGMRQMHALHGTKTGASVLSTVNGGKRGNRR